MPYCPQCGSETEPEAAFCGVCGAGLQGQGQAPAPPPTPHPPPPAREASRWPLIGGAVLAALIAVGGVALYDAAANDGDWADSIFGGGGGEEASVAAQSPTPEATVQPSPTVERSPTQVPPRRATVRPAPGPTVTPPPEEPPVAPPAWGYATPEEAIDVFLDVPYVGDCEWASLETDVGYYCSLLWEDRFDTLIYVVGPTFSEPDTWLLLAPLGAGDDWAVIDVAEFVPGPQDTVPPW